MTVRDLLRLGRRTLRALTGRDLMTRREIKVPRLRLGNPGAKWCVCPTSLGRESIVYSFGIGCDLSFELALIEHFDLSVHAFEPTPRSLSWTRAQSLPTALIIHEYGLGAWDGTARFAPPADPLHVSYSMLRALGDQEAISAPIHRLESIARMLGHTRIDLIKMDIEGAEYEVLPDCLGSEIAVGQLLVEFHHRWDEVGITRTKQALDMLRKAGYRIADVSPDGCEYTFLVSRGAHG